MLTNAVQLLRTPSPVRTRVLRVYGFLLVFNLAAWALTLLAAIQYPILLPAAGVAIAILGALLPAQWAARSRVTEVLQTE